METALCCADQNAHNSTSLMYMHYCADGEAPFRALVAVFMRFAWCLQKSL